MEQPEIGAYAWSLRPGFLPPPERESIISTLLREKYSHVSSITLIVFYIISVHMPLDGVRHTVHILFACVLQRILTITPTDGIGLSRQ